MLAYSSHIRVSNISFMMLLLSARCVERCVMLLMFVVNDGRSDDGLYRSLEWFFKSQQSHSAPQSADIKCIAYLYFSDILEIMSCSDDPAAHEWTKVLIRPTKSSSM